MHTIHLRRCGRHVGVECFDSDREFSDLIYNTLTSEEGVGYRGLYHLVGYRGEPYVWISFEGPDEPLEVAGALAAKLDAKLEIKDEPLSKMWMEKPPHKHWGIVIEGACLTRVLVEHTVNACSNFYLVKEDPRLELIRKASPFFQCLAEDYMYIEFWATQDTALEATMTIAEIVGVELDIR